MKEQALGSLIYLLWYSSIKKPTAWCLVHLVEYWYYNMMVLMHNYLGGGIYVGPQIGMSPILVWGLPDLEY